MSQVTIYLQDNLISKLKKRAQLKKESLSKYITSILEKKEIDEWPEKYLSLCGSIKEDNFVRAHQGSYEQDVTRKEM
ncbi:MAG: CopG family transcriptional regulator [Candidatus Omnitrophica bacterium]|nr:CopG family transcriptional regulator [Candidatus Omnitrophota bacterium]